MGSLATIDDELSDIDQQIAHLFQKQRELKSARNALVPLGRLPDEILLHIAQQLVGDTEHPCSSQLLTFTWTFRRVRAVVIGTGQLWTSIDLSIHTSLVHLFRNRASPCALDLVFDSKMRQQHYDLVLECATRAKTLFVHNRFTTERISISTEIPAPVHCSFLRTLELRSVADIKLLGHIRLPSLVTLRLVDFFNLSALPEVPHLQNLHLTRAFLSAPLLHSFLCRTPGIRTIDLDYVLHDDTAHAIHSGAAFTQVDLPELCRLFLHENPRCMSALLFFIPDPSMYLRVHVEDGASDPEHAWTSSPSNDDGLIVSRIYHFWTKRHGTSGALPSGKVVFDGWDRGDTLQIQFDAKEELSYLAHSCYSITEEDPLLDCVKTLHIRYVGRSRECDMADYLTLAHLHNIEDLVLEDIDICADDHSLGDIYALKSWICGRLQAGRPLRSIEIRGCGPSVQALFEELQTGKLAEIVFWND